MGTTCDSRPMVIGVVSKKGGAGKTTLAMHVAEILARQGKTLLVDEDDTRNATAWARRGEMPFTLTGMQGLAREARNHEHIVIDSRGGMGDDDVRDLYAGADRVIVPASAEFMVLTTLAQTLDVLRGVDPQLSKLRVVLTMVRPGAKLEEARAAIEQAGVRPMQATVRLSEAFRDATAQGVLVGGVKGSKTAYGCQQDMERVMAEVLA